MSISPPPSAPAHHRIESLHIDGGAHFAAARLDFVDGLNCIIGGYGAGKTTILHQLRFALGSASLSPARATRYDAQVAQTLGDGVATATVRTRHGIRYTSRRSAGDAPRVATEDGTPALVSLDGELFKVEVYGQSEIESMAESALAQLALIDKFDEPAFRALHDAIAHVERRLALNAAEVSRLDEELGENEGRAAELPTIAAALAAMASTAGPDVGEARRGHETKVLRAREAAKVASLQGELAAVRAAVDALDADARRRLAGPLDAAIANGPNQTLVGAAQAAAAGVAEAVGAALTQARAALTAAEALLLTTSGALAAAHAGQDEAYRAVAERHESDRSRTAERERLQRRFFELEALAKRVEGLRHELSARTAEREALRSERALRLDARFELRARIARELTEALDGRVRVSITRAGDHEAYAALLAEMLRGANVRPADFVREIARCIRPDDLAAQVRAGDTSALQAIDESKTGKAERAQRIVSALRASGRLFELETIPLGDVPLIELRIGATYQASSRVSTGQRCTAILPILLLQSASPLLIDQPEDNLDNAFVYEVLVKSIMRAKRSRQLIFVTHNPNIPVLGEAERVFVLEVGGEGGRVAEVGTVDEVRGSLERLLDGGREAFVRRGQRYGHDLR